MCGLISAEKLATMTSEEMASSEMKSLRYVITVELSMKIELPVLLKNKICPHLSSLPLPFIRDEFTKESIKDHQMAKTGGTNTSLFKVRTGFALLLGVAKTCYCR